MDSKDIVLTDGTLLNIKVNFYTLYLIKETKLDVLQTKVSKKPNDEMLQVEMAGLLIYVILRSNGKMVTKEEAMMLCPLDTESIKELMQEFSKKLEALKKKEDMKM